MSIIRVKKDANYFAASNEPFNDERLSWEARGLMGYLLSKPNDWKVQQKDIMNKGQAGERKVKRMLAELRKAGYMNRIRVTLEHNKFDWITEVYESPSQNPSPSAKIIKSKSQYDVLHSLEKPLTGKRTDIVSTDLLSTESNDNKELEARIALLCKLYSNNIASLIPLMADKLKDAALEFTDSTWYEPAFSAACSGNGRNWNYVYAVLKNWKAKGRDWKPQSWEVPQNKKSAKLDGVESELQKIINGVS
jgi:hypothetical protein